MSVIIRTVETTDAAVWEAMRQQLWQAEEGEHREEIARFFGGDRRDPAEALIALNEAGEALGFAEVSIRPYAEGCYSGRVAYLEGWFVEEAARRQGVGAALVKAAEDWGRAQGCTEFASDTDLENIVSAAAHLSLGFAVVERIVCFRKDL